MTNTKTILHLIRDFYVLLSSTMTVLIGLFVYDAWSLSQLSSEETKVFQGYVDSVSRTFEYHRRRQFPFDLIESRKVVIVLKGNNSQFIVSNVFENSHFPLMASLTDSLFVTIRTYHEITDTNTDNVFSIESSKGVLFDPLLVRNHFSTVFDKTWWLPPFLLVFTGFTVRTRYYKLKKENNTETPVN